MSDDLSDENRRLLEKYGYRQHDTVREAASAAYDAHMANPPPTEPETAGRSIESSGTVTPSDHEHHPTTKTLDYLGLGLLLAPPAVVLEMYLRGEPIDWRRLAAAAAGCFILGGFCVWASRNWRSFGSIIRIPSSFIIGIENALLGKMVIVAIFMAIPIITSPFFISSENAPPESTNAETQKATLIEWLQQAQHERDQEIAARKSAQAGWEADRQKLAATQSALEEAKLKLDQPHPAQQLQATSTSGPINWNFGSQFLVVTGGGANAAINSILLQGISTAPVSLKDAYVVSGLTGHKQELMANVQYKGLYPVGKVDIPPQAPVWLELDFKPSLSINDFIEQWGKLSFTVVYGDGASYQHTFEESYIRQQLQRIPGSTFGPHVTPKEDK